MRLVVTGSKGQVATALRARAAQQPDVELICLARPEFDLAQPDRLIEKIVDLAPDVVINAAAWTAVDAAESEIDQAYAVNAAGAGAVAQAAAACGAPIIQISTDYVFSGDKLEPYLETDATDPQGVYGASKLAGEVAVAAANPHHVILRTAWVYSKTGSNFLKTMLRLADTRDTLTVVNDQIGTPTHADEIAQGVLKVAENLHLSDSSNPDQFGVFHMSCGGQASWYDFAVEIFKVSKAAGGPSASVEPVPSSAYPTPTKRPANSCLNNEKLARVYGVRLAHWQDPLTGTVKEVLAQAETLG